MSAEPMVEKAMVVNLPSTLNGRRKRELERFAQYCAVRIARALDGVDRWEVWVAPVAGEVAVIVRARRLGIVVDACASAPDIAGGIWNAMCRIEQRLREVPWSQCAHTFDDPARDGSLDLAS